MPSRSEPIVRLQVQTDGPRERVDLGDRLIGFTFEDSDSRTDKASIQLDNWDLRFFESKLVVKGALLEVSWGYPGRMAPPRSLVVRRVKGFTALQVEAHARSVLMHREQRCRVFENMTRAGVAHQIAREHGFTGAFVHVEETEETYEVINQVAETDARLLSRLARREGFQFYVDQTGFHWHSRRFDLSPSRVYRYYTDPAQGDILGVQLDNDALAKPGRVRVRGRDPKRKTTHDSAGSDAKTPRDSLGDVVEIVDPETGKTRLERRNATASVRSSGAGTAGRGRREAHARFRTSSRKTIELRVRCVGDPEQLAKTIIELHGISTLLSGKYYVKVARHVIGGGGSYTMDLQCRRDATGRLAKRSAGGRPSARKRNTAPVTGKEKLLPVEIVDPETGRTRIVFRR